MNTACFEYNQIDAAICQLNRAITIFLDDKDFFSSATLAGAAEELFGKMLTQYGRKTSLQKEIDTYSEYLTNQELIDLAEKQNKEKSLIRIINNQRDWLKHLKNEDFYNYQNPEDEACALIARAIENYNEIFPELTSEMEKFRTFQQNKHD